MKAWRRWPKRSAASSEPARNVKRLGGAPGLPDGAVGQAFIPPEGGTGSAETRDGKSRVVFKVTEIIPAPPASPEELSQLRTELNRQLESDASPDT